MEAESFWNKKCLSLKKWTLPEQRKRIGSNPCGNWFWIWKKPRNCETQIIFLKFVTISKKLERTRNCGTSPSLSHFARPPNSPAPAMQNSCSLHTARLRRAQILRFLPRQFRNVTPRGIEPRLPDWKPGVLTVRRWGLTWRENYNTHQYIHQYLVNLI